jgi:hypothetical protein
MSPVRVLADSDPVQIHFARRQRPRNHCAGSRARTQPGRRSRCDVCHPPCHEIAAATRAAPPSRGDHSLAQGISFFRLKSWQARAGTARTRMTSSRLSINMPAVSIDEPSDHHGNPADLRGSLRTGSASAREWARCVGRLALLAAFSTGCVQERCYDNRDCPVPQICGPSGMCVLQDASITPMTPALPDAGGEETGGPADAEADPAPDCLPLPGTVGDVCAEQDAL